jgi:hypothetical protein
MKGWRGAGDSYVEQIRFRDEARARARKAKHIQRQEVSVVSVSQDDSPQALEEWDSSLQVLGVQASFQRVFDQDDNDRKR